jgi:hypothetical protein
MARVDTEPDGSTARPSGPYNAYRGPPNELNMNLRRVSAVALAILLYSAAMPFNPVGWFIAAEGAFFIDKLCAGVILLCACYFQWRISGLTHALAISLPTGSGTTIRNGRVEQRGDVIFLWQTSNYWPYAICETVLLCLAEFGPSEILRRSIVIGVVAGLWIVGWHATPPSLKRWAWGHIKALWFWIILSELLSVGRPSVGRRARRY